MPLISASRMDADQPGKPCQSQKITACDSQSSSTLEFRCEDGFELETEEYGHGAWSVVYKATTTSQSQVRLLAVKMPSRRDAKPVLAAEARILSQVSATSDAEEHVVPFHGFIIESSSIVMSAVSLTLSAHIEECAVRAKANISTRTMKEPVLSMPGWIELAKQLIEGLRWLHDNAGVVHGDIKPQNILLRCRRIHGNGVSAEFPFDALFADFSSAHSISLEETGQLEGVPLSALTPKFTAPELMTVAAARTQRPTPASDVFSLALTLLAAAIGNPRLYSTTNKAQWLAMTRESYRALDFVRYEDYGTRVPCKGLVERTIAPALVKDPSERVKPGDWLEILKSA